MLKLTIKGLKDGVHSFACSEDAAAVDGMFPQYYGEIAVSGEVRKIGSRYIVCGSIECMARLECDISNETYEERITAELQVSFVADSDLYHEHKDSPDLEQPYYIHEDASVIDITEEVRQQLGVSLPMKRVAPAYRGRSLEELYPSVRTSSDQEATDSDSHHAQETDARWEALKKIKFSDN